MMKSGKHGGMLEAAAADSAAESGSSPGPARVENDEEEKYK